MKALLVLSLLLTPASAFAQEKGMFEAAGYYAAKVVFGYKADRDYRDQINVVRRLPTLPQQTPDHIRFQTDQKLATKTDR